MAEFVLSAFSDEAGAALEEQLSALKRNGISRMEIRGVNDKSVIDLTDGEAAQVRAALDRAGVRLSAMGSPIGKYPIDQPFDAHLASLRRALELCGILGARRMRMFSFFIPKGEQPERWYGEVARRMERMLLLAQDAGVTLAHENEKGIYGDTDERCERLLRDFPELGCVFDPANFVQCGVRPIAAFERLEARVTYMHIKDALFAGGAVVPAGRGEGGVAEILRRLNARPGEMTLTLEPHLALFDGLKNLQGEPLRHQYTYPNAAAAFDAAAGALKELLAAL